MTQELKPCPFCGGEAHIDEWKDFHVSGDPSRDKMVYAISCENDDIYGLPCEDKDEVIRKWNTRIDTTDNGWIPVSEKLPERGKCVQIWREGLSIIPTNAYLYEYWINNTGLILDDVTHWRVLPEPPKSEKP